MQHASEVAEIVDLENRRISAVNSGDLDAIRSMLSDDYVQVHADGQLDTKDTLLQRLKGRGSTVKRDRPSVRFYGDVAVLTGELVHTLQLAGQPKVFRLFATQIAVKREGEWKFVSTQATELPSLK